MLKTISRIVAIQNNLIRNIHISSVNRLREIIVSKKDDKTTVIEGKVIPSPREPYLLKTNKDGKCPLCQLNLNLKHTDVLILSQYMDSQGKILKRFETSLCEQQYRLVKELIYMAQYAGLLPEPPATEQKKPYRLLNTYYDEATINLRPKVRKQMIKFKKLNRNLGPLEKRRIKPEVGFYYGPQQR